MKLKKSAINYGTENSTLSYGGEKSAIYYEAEKSAINYGAEKSAINYGSEKSAIRYGAEKSAKEIVQHVESQLIHMKWNGTNCAVNCAHNLFVKRWSKSGAL